MYTKEPSVKTAEFNVAKKWSLVGITEPKYFLTNSGWFWIASDIGQNIIPCLVNSSLKVVATETESNTGQFERTLIIADKGSYVSYLEGCTAPMRDENQLHAANVELIALDDAEIKYSTVQNWYPGDKDGKGGIYNFVTKRGLC